MRYLIVVSLALAAVVSLTVPAFAVHESYHGPFVGRTAQGERLVMRTTSHTSIGIRFRWRGTCDTGSVLRIARFRNVPVDENGRFFKHSPAGIGVRGKIGFDAQGNPVPPEPFKFSNNESKGRLRATVSIAGKGVCRSGLVKWEARR
ncbi:MAG TPA: hypothetical protein VGO83_15195 [Thermoleophilaceae bacterium]|jgi:hypothetical protein|nr:hypothetical protein [Thermoleophilaceae bacterium]